MEVYLNADGAPSTRCSSSSGCHGHISSNVVARTRSGSDNQKPKPRRSIFNGTTLRRSNVEKNLLSKKRVIQMLFVVVLEFFICWTPLYIINTITLFDHTVVYNFLGYQAISFFHLLAYSSSCCNPITYCFMNSSFRKAFLQLFGCRRLRISRYSTNSTSFYEATYHNGAATSTRDHWQHAHYPIPASSPFPHSPTTKYDVSF